MLRLERSLRLTWSKDNEPLWAMANCYYGAQPVDPRPLHVELDERLPVAVKKMNPLRLRSVHVLPKQQRPLRSLLHGVLISPRPSLPLSQAEIQDSPLLVLQSPSFILPQNQFDRITPTVSQGSDPRAARMSISLRYSSFRY